MEDRPRGHEPAVLCEESRMFEWSMSTSTTELKAPGHYSKQFEEIQRNILNPKVGWVDLNLLSSLTASDNALLSGILHSVQVSVRFLQECAGTVATTEAL